MCYWGACGICVTNGLFKSELEERFEQMFSKRVKEVNEAHSAEIHDLEERYSGKIAELQKVTSQSQSCCDKLIFQLLRHKDDLIANFSEREGEIRSPLGAQVSARWDQVTFHPTQHQVGFSR